jgi:hypothetical protein
MNITNGEAMIYLCANSLLNFDYKEVLSRPVADPMVTSKYNEICDDTDLVTNLATKAKRPHEVGVCY